jgi:hypothetical protein
MWFFNYVPTILGFKKLPFVGDVCDVERADQIHASADIPIPYRRFNKSRAPLIKFIQPG